MDIQGQMCNSIKYCRKFQKKLHTLVDWMKLKKTPQKPLMLDDGMTIRNYINSTKTTYMEWQKLHKLCKNYLH